MDKAIAEMFGRGWVAAWNNHDIDRVMAHYTGDFEMASPVIQTLAKEPAGTLKGKDVIKAYWSKALDKYPDLYFEFLQAFAGVDSVLVYYRGHRGLSAEVFHFNNVGKVYKAYAHYE